LRKTKEEALKEIKIICDKRFVKRHPNALALFEEKGCQTQVTELRIKGSIEWKRNIDGDSEESIDKVMVTFTGDEFTEIMEADQLMVFCDRIQKDYGKVDLFFIIQKLYTRHGEIVTGKLKDKLDEALISLQIERNVQILIHNSIDETVDYIYRLTAAIAEKPYKRTITAFEGFCAEAVSRRTPRSLTDSWISQLEQINSVSKTVAESIVEKYPTLFSLVSIYRSEALTKGEKQNLLADIMVKNPGSNSSRRIGPALSEKIYRLFTEKDPHLIL